MIGVLIVSHDGLGEALVRSVAHVLGGAPALVRPLAVGAGDDPERLLARARELVRELDQGDGVLVLADIYGATPGNIALRLLEPGHVEGVSGVNLPMLVRVLTYRHRGLAVALEKALSGGTEGVVHMTTDCCNGAR
ncbi:MAG: PTS fructose transporter subunit IIA [Burkholderiales bacterium]|nr:PTS fructose transporter subunit IIA [Burkholderiales bacterium]